MVEAIIGAMQHAATLDVEKHPGDATKQTTKDQVFNFTSTLRTALHNTFRYGQGTRDMSGPSGFTTEDFIDKVAWRLGRYLAQQEDEAPPPKLHEPDRKFRRNYDIDEQAVSALFAKYDTDGDGSIDFEEFCTMLIKMNIAPQKVKSEKKEKVPDV
jgi:isocitrate dehydrogenase